MSATPLSDEVAVSVGYFWNTQYALNEQQMQAANLGPRFHALVSSK